MRIMTEIFCLVLICALVFCCGRLILERGDILKAIDEGVGEFNSWHGTKLTFGKENGKWKLKYGEE